MSRGSRGGRGKGGGGNQGGGSRQRPEGRLGVDPTERLGLPPAAPRNGLRIVALGGIGEIGRNMTVFEHAGKLLIVDCGVLFPEDAQPGVDLILPDFRHIEDRMADVEAIVLTHGHEDHIG
ncbi:MAG: MBL fold metallo-hydrolase, partial [Mycobacteriaceae bacterium]